jgi:hypothetical protein
VIGHGRVLAEGTIPDLCAQTGTKSLRRAFFALLGQQPEQANGQAAAATDPAAVLPPVALLNEGVASGAAPAEGTGDAP